LSRFSAADHGQAIAAAEFGAGVTGVDFLAKLIMP
jgi:hypothetical protein